jgi:NAD+ synthase
MTANEGNPAALSEEIAAWLRQRLDESGAAGFVLGLSGGIDSAVVCGLCARAAGPERVLGAIMPARSNPTDEEHARLAAGAFGVEVVRVDLSPIVESFLTAMPHEVEASQVVGEPRTDHRAELALANVKPRLRMTTLYYLANQRGALVVGTGNKSEAMVGYFTKYGDGGVDLLPIVDLYKHQVRAVARVIGVPEPIIAKPPSAGLWPGQTDEAEMGLTYEQLDAALAAMQSGNEAGIDPAVMERVKRLNRVSEHKRRPIPVFRQADQSR